MSLADILIRSISGYFFVLPVAALHLRRRAKSQRGRDPLHILGVLALCYYLVGIMTMTGIGRLRDFAPRLILTPLEGVITAPMDDILNVILFLPLGLFLPLLYRGFSGAGAVAAAGFLLSLAVETAQLFGLGTSDVNDLIVNTIGALLGYGVYRLLASAAGDDLRGSFRASDTDGRLEVLGLTAYTFAVMVTVQPALTRGLFSLG